MFAAIFSLQLIAFEQGLVVCVVYVMQLFSLLDVFCVFFLVALISVFLFLTNVSYIVDMAISWGQLYQSAWQVCFQQSHNHLREQCPCLSIRSQHFSCFSSMSWRRNWSSQRNCRSQAFQMFPLSLGPAAQISGNRKNMLDYQWVLEIVVKSCLTSLYHLKYLIFAA